MNNESVLRVRFEQLVATGLRVIGAVDPGAVKGMLDDCQRSFGNPATGLIYHHRLNGPKDLAVLSAPEEIARGEVGGKPMPYGYGSGIQDIALENGQALFALCEAHAATGDAYYVAKARGLVCSTAISFSANWWMAATQWRIGTSRASTGITSPQSAALRRPAPAGTCKQDGRSGVVAWRIDAHSMTRRLRPLPP